VSLGADSPRRGLLGQGSVLTVTSTATRTSPVSRGKWVLENLLGTPAPVPPPGVETNLGGQEAAKTSSVRERLEAHRASPQCASCHRIMDPMGFALENFDLVGGWREFDGPSRIDSKGQLADGTPVGGPADLRRAVLSRSDAFMTTATEKLMTYALGRPVHDYDMPAVRAIVRRAGANNNRFSSAGHGHHRERLVPKAREEVGPVLSDRPRRYRWHSSRKRTCHVEPSCNGAGVTLALPLLESMIPAATLLGQTAATPRTRLGAIYFPHGAIMPLWTPAAEGAGFELTPDPPAAQAVLQPDQHHQRPAPCECVRERRDGESQSLGRRVSERRLRRDRRPAVARHHRRSDCRAEDRAGHSPAIARADHRRTEPQLR
jgi:hypothetical protein